MAAASLASASGALPSRAASASHRWNVAPWIPASAPKGSARTRAWVSAPCAAATRCASAGATPCFSRNSAASLRPRESPQAPASFAAVFAPTPGHSRSRRSASGASKAANTSTPKCATSLAAVAFPTPGSAPPARYRSIASSSAGATSSGAQFSTNCVPHFSTSRQSPVISRLVPSAAPGMCPTTVTVASRADASPFPPRPRFLYLPYLEPSPPPGTAVAPTGRDATSAAATRTRATV